MNNKERKYEVHCGVCPFNDGLCYTSSPPMYKCNITGEFHRGIDSCGKLKLVYEDLPEPAPETTYVVLNQPDCSPDSSGYPYTIAPSSFCSTTTTIKGENYESRNTK